MVLGTYREVNKSFYLTGTYTTYRETHTQSIHIHTQEWGGKKKKERDLALIKIELF